MEFRRKQRIGILFFVPLFFIFSCGGGGGGGSNPPPPPTATTTSATNITTDSATANGTVNPNGVATDAWFEFGTDPALATFDNTSVQSLGSGTTAQNVSASLPGLSFATTYYFRMVAQSTAGTEKGAIVSFSTSPPPPPTVSTDDATSITSNSATANGSVNPNGLPTDAWFEWGTDPTLTIFDNTTTQSLAAGTSVQFVNAPLTGLTFGTTYYYRAVAMSTSGTVTGTIKNFSTSPVPPTVATSSATSITTTGADLNGSVNPNGLATNALFEWGTDPTLATFTTTPVQILGNGTASLPITESLTGLGFGTTYYFRVSATNAAGTQTSSIESFSTANPPPVANAGPDDTVVMGLTVTLDGSGSSSIAPPITYLWEQVAGAAVTLSDNTAAMPTFTAPTVPLIGGVLRFQLTVTDQNSLTASDNVDITTLWGFSDDFSADTTGDYPLTNTNPPNPIGDFVWDQPGERAQLLTGDNIGTAISHALPGSDSGAFSFDFLPTVKYPSGGGIWVRLRQDANNYYEVANFDWDNTVFIPPSVAKVVGGVTVDNVAIATPYTQNPGTPYNIIINYSPATLQVIAFGETINLTADNSPITVSSFEIENGQQDAYYDNILLLALP